MLNEILKLVADFKAGNWAEVLRGAGKVLATFGDWYEAFVHPTVGAPALMQATDEELDAAIADLEACCAAPPVMQADPKAIDPATVLLIVKAVIEFIKWWRDRRNP